MINDLWWVSIWAITGGGPLMFTVTVNGLNYRNVSAEACLSKIVLPDTIGAKHTKATVLNATFGPTTYTGTGLTQSTYSWGINGSPIRDLPMCSYMTFALEVNGIGTFAQMTGKLFIR